MRVVSFNIKGAFVPGRASHDEQRRSWHLLAAFGADIALVQEVDPAAIPSWAFERWTIVKASPGVGWIDKPAWGSMIAAAPALKLRPRDDLFSDPWLAQVYEYVVVGEIDLPDGETALVASVHAAARTVRDFFSTNARRTNPLTEVQTKTMGGVSEPRRGWPISCLRGLSAW